MTREEIEKAIKCCNPYDEDCGACPFNDLSLGRCFEALAKTAFNMLLEDREKLQKQVKTYQDKIEQGTLKEEKTCENISEMHPVDGFTCSECGITIIDFREERVDEEDCTASWYEYEFKYCPNCGARITEHKELQK